uniref:Putative ribonuclease H-like domain-containing protein n=1 Tax=Tanacetum cinerariifolium TaxID=118510 RepID=A0A6L2LLZ1_TANCI|nr:putative ribonuclease H-like domain-containing protein [Tanacetum cinerariifolium]
MGRDTIQLENAVSTISQEYLLEFTFEYGIPESLHSKLPGPEDPIVEFLEGKVGVYTNASNPTKVKTGTRPRTAHEVPLLTATANRVIDMGDTIVASGSSGTPASIEKSSLDFANEDPPSVITERGDEATAEVIPGSGLGKEVAAMGHVMNKRRRKRENKGSKANAPPKADSTSFVPMTQESLVNAKSVSDPDPLSYVEPRPIPEQDTAHSYFMHVVLIRGVDVHSEFPGRYNKLIEKGAGLNWLFDIDTLTNSMNYVPVVVAGTSSTNFSAHLESSTSNAQYACNADAPESSRNSNPTATSTNPLADQMETVKVEYVIPTVSSPVLTACLDDSTEPLSTTRLILKRVTSQDETSSLDNLSTLSNRFEDILGVTTNTDTPVHTRHQSKEMEEQSFIATIHQKTTPDLLQFYLFSCFLSQEEPKKIADALKDLSWVEDIQEELLQFKIQNVWILVDCPNGVRPIRTKWVLKNKKDERGIVIRNKARLVAQVHTQEERIDYEKGCAPVARIEVIRLFLANASFMGFTVYQMGVKSAFLYGTIDEEVYVMQPPGFHDLEFLDKVYKVEKEMYGLHQASRA